MKHYPLVAIAPLFLILSLIFFSTGIFAQPSDSIPTDTLSISNDTIGEKSEVRVDLSYTSDYLYMGRSDAVKAPYLSPSITYLHKTGLFLYTSFSYLTAKDENRIDLYTLSGGYEHYGKRLSEGISISEYFFNDMSYVVQSEVNTYISAFVSYNFGIFILYLDGSVGFSDGTDYFLNTEMNRKFYLLKDKLRIMPSVSMNSGSQTYYNEYYKIRSTTTGIGKNAGKGKKPQQQLTTKESFIEESDKFQVLDYETSLQLKYSMKKMQFLFTTTWTFPVNPSTVVTEDGTFEEELKNGFYWSTGIRYTFSATASK